MAAVAARVPSPGSDAGVHRRLGCGALVLKVCGVLTSDVIGQVGIVPQQTQGGDLPWLSQQNPPEQRWSSTPTSSPQ
jgi:hypothetical protein